jgi:hypothetical protein
MAMSEFFSCASVVPRLRACLWLGASLLVASAAQAHGSHSHGHGTVHLVVEGTTLTATFDVPLEAFLGYDHLPQGAAQEQVWSAFKARLQDPSNFLQPAADARCQAVGHEARPDPSTADAKADIPNIVYRAEFRCDQPEALHAVSFTAFRDHPGLKQLRVQLASPKGRRIVTVRPRFPALTF